MLKIAPPKLFVLEFWIMELVIVKVPPLLIPPPPALAVLFWNVELVILHIPIL
jgi:hypothetical protein